MFSTLSSVLKWFALSRCMDIQHTVEHEHPPTPPSAPLKPANRPEKTERLDLTLL